MNIRGASLFEKTFSLVVLWMFFITLWSFFLQDIRVFVGGILTAVAVIAAFNIFLELIRGKGIRGKSVRFK